MEGIAQIPPMLVKKILEVDEFEEHRPPKIKWLEPENGSTWTCGYHHFSCFMLVFGGVTDSKIRDDENLSSLWDLH